MKVLEGFKNKFASDKTNLIPQNNQLLDLELARLTELEKTDFDKLGQREKEIEKLEKLIKKISIRKDVKLNEIREEKINLSNMIQI